MEYPIQFPVQDFSEAFISYKTALERKWIRIILILGITLIPLFGLLDLVMMPPDSLRVSLGIRAVVTAICIIQYYTMGITRDRWVIFHAFFFTFMVGAMISFMTTRLGGFQSSYYAGLNLVIIAVNFFLPLTAFRCALNGLQVIVVYVIINLLLDVEWEMVGLINNLFFMGGTVIIAATISHHKYNLTRGEFNARSSLWGEMEIARKIQTALLPAQTSLPGFQVAGIMRPATEVGGDFYDVIQPEASPFSWITIGDVSGHGVTAGLIMMMTQTSISSFIHREPDMNPSGLLGEANEILKFNISRLGGYHYITMTALRIGGNRVTFAGKHQDILVYQKQKDDVEIVKTKGFWLGMVQKIESAFSDDNVTMNPGDIMMLYTDGVTELMNQYGEMFGMERLIASFWRFCREARTLEECLDKILKNILDFGEEQDDDITIVLLQKT